MARRVLHRARSCLIAAYSVGALHLLPTDTGAVSLDSWKHFLTGDSVYLGLFWKSVRVSLTVSIVVVLLAYPIGYFLALCVRKRKYVLLLVIIAPFLTSYLLRVLAWKVILGERGVVNSALYRTASATARITPSTWLIYSQFAVMLVLAYVWIPFVALPIFVSLEQPGRIAARGGGRSGREPVAHVLRVTFPLSLPRRDRGLRLRVRADDRRVRHPAGGRRDEAASCSATRSTTGSRRRWTGRAARCSRCSC